MIRKKQISQANFQMLFGYLTSFLEIEDKDFHPHLMEVLSGYWCPRQSQLHMEGDICKKTWFITKGMAYLYFTDKHKGAIIFMLFGAGEIAIIPDSFMNGNPSTCYIIACSGTELLEITRDALDLIHTTFPQSLVLENAILAKIPEKAREREALLRLGPEARMISFFNLYIQVHPNHQIVKMNDKDIANFLHIDQSHYSKLKNQMFPKKSRKKLAYTIF